MSDGSGIPKFPGELSSYLPRGTPEPPDRWSDRIRHAWLWYLILAVLTPVWITAVILAIVYFGQPLGYLSSVVVVLPFGMYARVILWRALSGRDPDTGERIGSRDR